MSKGHSRKHIFIDRQEISLNRILQPSACTSDKMSVIRTLEANRIPVVEIAAPDVPLENVVVKPKIGLGGKGVVANVTSRAFAFKNCKAKQDSPKYECYAEVKQKGMRHYRVTSLNNQFVWVHSKRPLTLLGDGNRSLRSLLLHATRVCPFENHMMSSVGDKTMWNMIPARGQIIQPSLLDNGHLCGTNKRVTNPRSLFLASQLASSVSRVLFPGLVSHLYSIDYWAKSDTSPPIVGEVNCRNTGLHRDENDSVEEPWLTIFAYAINATRV